MAANPLFRRVGSTLYYDTYITEAGGSFKPGWDFKPEYEYNSLKTVGIPLGELSIAMYADDEGSFFKKDLDGNRTLQIRLEDNETINAYGYDSTSREWKRFPLTSNMDDGETVKVTVTGVLKYKNPTEDNSPEKYVYLYKYTNGGITYTDVVIDQDEYEIRPFTVFGAPAAKRYRPETTYLPNAGFKYTGSSPGYAHNLNLTTPPEPQPNSGAGGGGNARNPTLGGARKHKRTRKQLSTTLKEDPPRNKNRNGMYKMATRSRKLRRRHNRTKRRRQSGGVICNHNWERVNPRNMQHLCRCSKCGATQIGGC